MKKLLPNTPSLLSTSGLIFCLSISGCNPLIRDNEKEAVIEEESISALQAPQDKTRSIQARLAIKHFDTLHLSMDALDSNVIFRKEKNDNSSFPLKVTAGTNELAGEVTVSGSFTRNFPKKNLRIKLNKGQQWRGHNIISLDAMATDGSMLREWLTWELLHELGVPGPQSKFIRVFINNQYKGVFLLTEWITPELLSNYGLGEGGQFFNPVDSKFCGDFRFHENRTLKNCWFKLSPNDNDFAPLQSLSDGINSTSIDQFASFHDATFENDTLINWLLVNVLTSNGDTYNKNYFLYSNEFNGKWNVIPWDYDLTFGRNWDAFLPFPNDIINDNFVYFYPPQLGASNPLKEKVLRNPELRKRFNKKLLHLLGLEKDGPDSSFGWFTPKQVKMRIDSMADQLYQNRKGDPFLQNSLVNHRHETESLWHYAQRRYAYLREIIAGDNYQWDADQALWEFDPEASPERSPLAQNLHLRSDINKPYGQKLNDKEDYELITIPGYGYLMAAVRPRDGFGDANFSIESFIDTTPSTIPPGYRASDCIQRNWHLMLRTPFQERRVDLQLDYLEENSKRNELGAYVIESLLSLWVLDGQEWREQPALFNPRSNVITIDNLEMQSNRMLHFVACSKPLTEKQAPH